MCISEEENILCGKIFCFFQVVYIAPMKALVRERVEDWRVRFQEKLNKKVVELTGDVSPDIRAIQVIIIFFVTRLSGLWILFRFNCCYSLHYEIWIPLI